MRQAMFAVSLIAVAGSSGCSREGARAMLSAGSPVPSLQAVDQHGTSHALADYRGKPTVVYFYPKDGTPGCTKEACAFRDIWSEYEKANVAVLGVSTDDQKSKEAFAKENRLPFPILADPDAKWVEAFGVSSTLGMASRVTFLLGPDGNVAKVYPDVDPGVHAAEVLADATALPR
jgi:thioredoxin-dependent peroxiredoxin